MIRHSAAAADAPPCCLPLRRLICCYAYARFSRRADFAADFHIRRYYYFGQRHAAAAFDTTLLFFTPPADDAAAADAAIRLAAAVACLR